MAFTLFGSSFHRPTPTPTPTPVPGNPPPAVPGAINGTNGHDVLRGTAGNDVIVGGGSSDTLTGGGGADTFKYQHVADSAIGVGGYTKSIDTIIDFQHGVDKIDLSSMIDGDNGGVYYSPSITYDAATNTTKFVAQIGFAETSLYTTNFEIDFTGNVGLTFSDFNFGQHSFY